MHFATSCYALSYCDTRQRSGHDPYARGGQPPTADLEDRTVGALEPQSVVLAIVVRVVVVLVVGVELVER